jgi:SpoVK/Ycf46/Vps4 family AAA+-type ATPase
VHISVSQVLFLICCYFKIWDVEYNLLLGHDEDVIELPLDLHPSLASEFNTTSEPIKVSVRPLPNVPVAEQVIFEPLSTSDWELIEMEASVLEDGGLLNQITIVYPGQVFPLRLVSPGESYSGGLESAAWIRVVAEDGFDSDETDSIFASDSDSSQSELCGVNYNCLRLMAETEVSVIPKPRLKNDDENEPSVERDSTRSNDPVYAHSCPLRVQFTSPSDHETTTTSMPPISLLGCAYVHSYTLKHLPGYQQMFETELACLENVSDLPSAVVSLSKWDDKKCTEESECALARINASDSVREGHITMHECLRIQIGATPLTNCVCVQILPHSHLIDSLARSREDIAQGRKTIKLESVSLKELDFTDIISDSTKDEETASAIQTSTLISSGFIIPVATLRSLLPERKNWSNQCCLFSLKFESTTGDKSVRAASRLGSVITGDDLKRLLEKNGQNECITSGARSQTQSTPTASTKATAIHTAPVDMYVEGFSSTIERLIQDISKIISFPRICGATAHRNAILLTGERGCGKTHLALTLASRSLRLNSIGMVYLDCKKLQTTPGSTTSSILKEIQSSFEQALRKQPSLLILDDLDAVIPNCENSDGGDGSIHHQQTNPALVSQVKAVADHLVRYTCQCGYSNVVLLCTCRDDDSLAARYKNSGIFYSSVEVPSLNFHQRTKFLHHCVLGKRSEVEPSFHDIPHCILKLGKMTDGFRPHDLKLLTARIRNAQYLRQIDHSSQEKTFVGDIAMESGKVSLEMLEKDVASAIEEFTPLSQQSVDITQNKCTVDWSSVGGLKHAKQSLYDVIIHPMNFKAIYDNLPTSLPTGVLLYGFPGCGKSFIVPALAKASNLSLISCRGPELLDRYIGASEAKVRQLFAQAVEAAPSLIFFDDFDSLAPQRGSDHTGVTDRVVNQLLTLLDGAERNTKTSQIYIVAATSRPDKIDSALLRPGRLETHVYVGYPESLLEWEELFSSILSSWNVDEEVSLLRQKKELCSVLCKDLSYVKDLSAADMKAVMDTAHLMRVHEMLDDEDDCESPQNETPPGVIICKSHIIEAFKRTRPSLLPEDRQKLQRYYQPFRAEEKYTSDQDTANALKTSFR